MGPTINLNVKNFALWRTMPRRIFEGIRFDANNNCNIHCAYCHIPRSDELIEIEEFREFVTERVEATTLFQFGCQMEPTLDNRLVDFIEIVAQSAAKPTRTFRLQTNGILLHRHDHERIAAAGINFLGVSMDAADPEIVKQLRGGTSLQKVYRNVQDFHRHCPTVRIAFITTVTRANIGAMDALVEAGLEAGATIFNLRQVAYQPANEIVDHALMRDLVITTAEFLEVTVRIEAKYRRVARFAIQSSPVLTETAFQTRAASSGMVV